MRSSWLLPLATVTTLGGLACVVGLVRYMAGWPASAQRWVISILLLGYGLAIVTQPDLGWWRNVLVLTAAAAGALLLSSWFHSPEAVVVFLLTAAAVDLISFSGGLTARILEGYRSGTSDVLVFLSLAVPVGGRLTPIVGIGDLLVGSAAASVLIRFGVPVWQVGVALSSGLLFALLVGIRFGGAPAIPAMAAAVSVLMWCRRKRRSPA